MKTLLAVIEKKTTIPVLELVHVKDKVATATDLDMWVQLKTDNLAGGLYAGIGFDRDDLRKPSQIAVSDYPMFDHKNLKDVRGVVKVSEEEMKFVAKAQCTEDTRYYLCGIAFDGQNMVATDGHRLNMVKLKNASFPLEMAAPIVPSKAIKLILSAMKEEKVTTVEMKFYKDYVVARVGLYKIVSKLIDGTYPDYNRVIPQDDVATKTTLFNPGEIVAILKDAKVLARRDGVKLLYAKFSGRKVSFCGKEWKMELTEFKIDCGFNLPYLADAAAGQLSYNDESSPIKITNPKGYTSIVMPVRV